MTITTVSVTGMTCGHCADAVTRELRAVVSESLNVDATVVDGGESTVRIESDGPLPEAAVREAIEEAGYSVVAFGSDAEPQPSGGGCGCGGCGCGGKGRRGQGVGLPIVAG